MSAPSPRGRREPPRFRTVEVRRAERATPRLVGVTLGGPALQGFALEQPAASVRLLLPSATDDPLVIPEWTGNEFLLPDGRRPVIRTLTPRRFDPDRLELAVEVVDHGAGAVSSWATTAVPGDVVAVSGPGRGYAVDPDAPGFWLAGDETALPAIGQLLEALPAGRPVAVHVEVSHPDARLALPTAAAANVYWWDQPAGAPPGDTLVAAVVAAELVSGTRVWAAGEAAAMQRIRQHLFGSRGYPRALATVRGYWKQGRGGDADDEGA